MTSKKFVKAFIAGLALPAIILPVLYTLLYFNVRNALTHHALQFLPMFLPLAWGLANALFIRAHEKGSAKTVNRGLIVTGAILGFLVALFGVYVAHVPEVILGKLNHVEYAPLVVLPILYAILFRYVVKWINKEVGL